MALLGGRGGNSALLGQTIFDGVPLPLVAGNNNNVQVSPDDFTALFLQPIATCVLTGIRGAHRGRWLVLINDSPSITVTINNQDSGSLAQNRFSLNGANVTFAPGAIMLLLGTANAGWLMMATSAAGSGGFGTVTDVAVNNEADDFVLGVANPTTTPSISFIRGGVATYVAAAGQSNNVVPVVNWPVGYDRLDVNVAAGNANFTGLEGFNDGQEIVVRNIDTSGNTLTLNSQNAASTNINRFSGAADLILVNGAAAKIKYYGGTVNRWIIVT